MKLPRRVWLLPTCLATGLALSGCLAPVVLGSLAGAGGVAAGGAALGGAAAGAAGTATAGAAAATGVAAAAGTAAAVGATGAAVGAGVATGTVVAGTAAGAGIGVAAVGAGAAGGTVAGVGTAAGPGVGGSLASVGGVTSAALGSAGGAGTGLSATATGAANSAALARAGLAIGAATRYVPNEILVANLSPATLDRARRLGFEVTEASLLDRLALTVARLRPPAGRDPAQALALLREGDAAARYELNPVYRLAADGRQQPADCRGLRCYPQNLLAWPGRCSAQPRIGMLDSSVDAGHPALAGRRLQRQRFGPGSASPREREHGTAVAALLLGAPGSGHAGLLPEAQLFAAEVFSADREGAPYTDAVRLAQGLDWLAAQGVQVVNISLAGPESSTLHTAVRRLVQSGVGVVAAVGNLGPEAPRQYPAAFPEAMAVTAIDRNRRLYARANRGDYVALAAPGVAIWTADVAGGGSFRDGTSFAAPYVTAAYALLASTKPDLAPFGLLRQLQQQALPLAGAPALLQAPACKS